MITIDTLQDNPSNNRVKHFTLKTAALIVMFSLIFIGCFYLLNYQNYLVVPAQSQLSWASKLLALLHSSTALIIATLFLSKVIKLSTWAFLINITRGYLIAALVIHFFYPNTSHSFFTDLMHHIPFFCITLYIHKYPKYIAMGFFSEAALLPMYSTWYLLKWSLQNSLSFKLFALLTLVLYLVCRVLLFTYLFWGMWKNYRDKRKGTTLLEAILILPITILNYYWFGLLLQKAYVQLA